MTDRQEHFHEGIRSIQGIRHDAGAGGESAASAGTAPARTRPISKGRPSAGSIGWLLQAATAPPDASGAAILGALSLVAAGLAYGLVRALGMIVIGFVGMALDGPEVTISRRAISHDIRLGATWAILLEVALFLAAAAMIVFSGIDAVKHQSAYSACVFVLLFALSFWPYLRHRIKHGDWP